jgi:hypothetical protein
MAQNLISLGLYGRDGECPSVVPEMFRGTCGVSFLTDRSGTLLFLKLSIDADYALALDAYMQIHTNFCRK